MMYISPLEQFTVYKLLPLSLGSFDFSFTNSSFFAFFVSFLILFLFSSICSNARLIPTVWQTLLETFYEFVFYNIVSENIKKGGNLYFPILLSIFFFILFCNVLGLIPYGFTVTSHIVITFGLALAIFLGINFIGIKTHGLHMLCLFLPGGAPLAMAPFLVAIELISYIFRVLSLAIRLFANMMSGHCLLKIIAGFGWTMFSSGGILSILHLVPLIVIFLLFGLEFGIAFLQAYVFTLLLCVYLNDAISLH